MAYRTDNPVMDAQDYVLAQDNHLEPTYFCHCCGVTFESGFGVRITDETFCNKCIAEYKHHNFYLRMKVSAQRIDELDSFYQEKL